MLRSRWVQCFCSCLPPFFRCLPTILFHNTLGLSCLSFCGATPRPKPILPDRLTIDYNVVRPRWDRSLLCQIAWFFVFDQGRRRAPLDSFSRSWTIFSGAVTPKAMSRNGLTELLAIWALEIILKYYSTRFLKRLSGAWSRVWRRPLAFFGQKTVRTNTNGNPWVLQTFGSSWSLPRIFLHHSTNEIKRRAFVD